MHIFNGKSHYCSDAFYQRPYCVAATKEYLTDTNYFQMDRIGT